jgi:hypothetical protein
LIIRVLHGIDSLASREWDRLSAPRVVYETREWMSATEPLLPGTPLITAEFGDEGLESLVAWQVMRSEDPSPYFNIGGLLARLTERPLPDRGGWTLNCAGMEMHSQLLTAPGVVFDARLLGAHIDAAVAARPEPPVMCGVSFLPSDSAPGAAAALAELGFTEIRGYKRAILKIQGGSYEEHLAALPKGKRTKSRRDRRLFTKTGQRTVISTGPAAGGDDLVRLHRLNREKYGSPDNDEQELRKLHTMTLGSAGEDSLVVRSYRGDTCTGFAMFARSGDILYAMATGAEPHQDKIGPYFECLYHAAIEWSCRNGIREIDYGIGATRAKAQIGCTIVDVSSWYLDSAPS